MGGNLLRRKILSGKALVLLLIAAAGFFRAGEPLSADENSGSAGTVSGDLFSAEENPGESLGENAVLFPRPLRSRRAPETESIPFSKKSPGVEQYPYPESRLLLPSAMEHPLVRQYIRQYSSPGALSRLSSIMERAGPYLAFVRREIAARGLPEELLYLPVIESGYLATAVSKSGAAGLWQFMRNSVGPFDIKINDWVDERRDFWKSTQGALRKLEENYNYLGDWPLALAAYNAGLGAVNQALRRSGGVRNYWTLSEKKLLKTETVQYVPKLLAAAYILSNPRRFGMEALWPEDPRWERVAVERPADLRLLAEKAGIDSGELIRANRELLYNVTPAGQNYFLKVRGADAEKAAAVLASKDIPLIRYYFHTIRSGDTLLALALHYGTPVEQIIGSNPGVRPQFLRIGSRLIIPALKETGPYARRPPPGENPVFSGSHLVKRGETLWSIALAYELDPEVLAEANGMALSDILREGRTLKTPIK